jgi:glucose/arabinose dehydrogenase
VLKRISVVFAVCALALFVSSTALGASATPVSPSALNNPTAFTVTPDGFKIIYGERATGEIRLINLATGTNRLLFTITNVASAGEQGLLGLAVRATYPLHGRVWAFVTRTVNSVARNQLVRINATGSGMSVLRSLPASQFHNSGRIMFGPDDKLYVAVGDNGNPANAQDLNTLAGKILRLNPDGTVPSGSPSPGSPLIGYGIRNTFGFTFDPRTGRLWETENGPECNDEINRIPTTVLKNYGWGPSWTCSTPPSPPLNTNQDGLSPVLPRLYFRSPPALTGAAFCNACGLGTTNGGRLFFGDFNGRNIRRATLGPLRYGITSHDIFYTHSERILSVETPKQGGRIYFSTTTNIYRLNP